MRGVGLSAYQQAALEARTNMYNRSEVFFEMYKHDQRIQTRASHEPVLDVQGPKGSIKAGLTFILSLSFTVEMAAGDAGTEPRMAIGANARSSSGCASLIPLARVEDGGKLRGGYTCHTYNVLSFMMELMITGRLPATVS